MGTHMGSERGEKVEWGVVFSEKEEVIASGVLELVQDVMI